MWNCSNVSNVKYAVGKIECWREIWLVYVAWYMGNTRSCASVICYSSYEMNGAHIPAGY